MKKFKSVTATALALFLAFGMAACSGETTGTTSTAAGGEPAEGEFLLIGNPQPLSGIHAQVGNATTQAVELAIEYVNENGGFNGVPLRLVNYDDQGSPEVAVQLAHRMLQQDNVDLIIGTLLSSNLMATGDIFENAGILVMGNGTSPTLMDQGWEFMFRVAPNNGFAMPAKIDIAIQEGWMRAAVIHGLDDATRSGAEAFIEISGERGVEIVAVESYIDGDTDFAGQLARIINADADVVFVSASGPIFPLIVRQLRLMDYDGQIFFREAPTADAVEVAGEALEGVMFVYPYITYDYPEQADDPYMVEFLQRFLERHGEMPFHDAAYRAWDAVLAMREASRIAGSNDSEAMRQAMHQVQFRGLGGNIDFTTGDREGRPDFRVWTIRDGRPVPYGS